MSRRSVVFDKRLILLTGLATCFLGLLTSCANSPTGEALERSFSADPTLKDNPNILGGSSPADAQNPTTAKLPEDFPVEIPRYPGATLESVESLTAPNTQGQRTSWSSADPINAIQRFYQQQFGANNWQIVSQPEDDMGGTIVARRGDLQVTLTVPSSGATTKSTETPATTQSAANGTNFELQYIRGSQTTAEQSPDTGSDEREVPSYVPSQSTGSSSASSQNFTDLDKVPQPLRQQIEDLAALGVLTVNSTGSQFEPNKPITRREFARWLVAANNQMYTNRPAQQIRLASETAQPAFRDLPKSDRDFPSIQALAEAGLIPSSLSGDSTSVLFRPDVPLTRENLIMWKVPLDTRQALPAASLDAVKQTWGFQDVGKIDPKALRAMLADFQNSDQANIRRVFGYTTLFQPKKPVTRAEAAAALWYFGAEGEGLSAKEALQLKSNPPQESSEKSSDNSTSQ